MLGYHHGGETNFVAMNCALHSPLKSLARSPAGPHVRVKDKACFHRHINSPKDKIKPTGLILSFSGPASTNFNIGVD